MPYSPRNLPDLVIFDNDGVLIDSEIIAAQATANGLRAYGIEMSVEECMHAFVGLGKPDMLAKLEAMGHRVDDNLDEHIQTAFLAESDAHLQAVKGAHETLAAIRAANIPVCVCSNAGLGWIERTHKQLGLFEHFTSALYFHRDLVKTPKPAPDMHALALDTFGVRADRALVIEDTTAGAGGAHAAGIPVWGFVGASGVEPKRRDALLDQGADRVFDNHESLRNALLGA